MKRDSQSILEFNFPATKKIKVYCYDKTEEYRFYVTISADITGEKRIRAEVKAEIKKVKERFNKKSYGASFGKIKSIRVENITINL